MAEYKSVKNFSFSMNNNFLQNFSTLKLFKMWFHADIVHYMVSRKYNVIVLL